MLVMFVSIDQGGARVLVAGGRRGQALRTIAAPWPQILAFSSPVWAGFEHLQLAHAGTE